jgi:vacuolar-type H+-ATPase subunit H
VRGFHAYAGWLVSITWRRFLLLSLALLVGVAILEDLPIFRWTYTEHVPARPAVRAPIAVPPVPPVPPVPEAPSAKSRPSSDTPREPIIKIEKPRPGTKTEGVDISIDERGIRITPKAAASAASGDPARLAASSPGAAEPVVEIHLPEGATSQTVREAVAEARRDIQEAVRSARQDAAEAAQEAADNAREAARTAEEATRQALEGLREQGPTERVHVIKLLNGLPQLALLWILGSAIIKITYKQQIQAQAQAAQAVETAEAESLKRQVVEARMAAMQAQVEPHFLFNTLASIDHLIEVDPKRASVMQKNLIALLRASMPTMREAGDGGPRDLGRELTVIRPYLEILKVRMEERLSTEIDVPDGLLSAEFPQMMVQTLVENAIKHGLEPKPEGGHLRVKAEIVHGKLVVSVADTGLGFGRAATAGTGVGLANIRERLQLLYGAKASLAITENPGGGTITTVTVPYKPLQGEAA